jgi:hypothetical protein
MSSIDRLLERLSLKILAEQFALAFDPVKDRASRDRDAAALRAVLERTESQSSNLAMALRTSSILRMPDNISKANP